METLSQPKRTGSTGKRARLFIKGCSGSRGLSYQSSVFLGCIIDVRNRLSYLANPTFLFRGCKCDLPERQVDFVYDPDQLRHVLAGLTYHAVASRDMGKRIFDEQGNRLHCFVTSLRQNADFGRYDGETATLRTRSRRLDSGVERQNIRLRCDAGHNLHEATNRLGTTRNTRHPLDDAMYMIVSGRHRFNADPSETIHPHNAFCILLHCRVKLLDAGRGLLKRRSLLLRPLGKVIVTGAQSCRPHRYNACSILNSLHRRSQCVAHSEHG